MDWGHENTCSSYLPSSSHVNHTPAALLMCPQFPGTRGEPGLNLPLGPFNPDNDHPNSATLEYECGNGKFKKSKESPCELEIIVMQFNPANILKSTSTQPDGSVSNMNCYRQGVHLSQLEHQFPFGVGAPFPILTKALSCSLYNERRYLRQGVCHPGQPTGRKSLSRLLLPNLH